MNTKRHKKLYESASHLDFKLIAVHLPSTRTLYYRVIEVNVGQVFFGTNKECLGFCAGVAHERGVTL